MDKNGILGTILYLVVLLLMMLLLGFSTPLPLPAEKGILINFGTSENGSGNLQPEKKSEIEKSVKPQKQSSTNTPEQGKKTYMTQDFEEAPSIPKTFEKKNHIKPSVKETPKTNTTSSSKQPAKETKKEAETPKINPNALYKGNKNNTSSSEGETGKTGDQGDIKGDINSTSHSLGFGSGGGVSFSLEGRSYVSLPTPVYEHQNQGKVVVEITVDKAGNVVNAVPGIRGSTTLDTYLLESARKAAMRSTFNSILEGPAFQKGTITYVFKLQ